MLSFIVSFTALVASTQGILANRCTFPDRWSGTIDNEEYYVSDQKGTVFSTFDISYDAANERVAFDGHFYGRNAVFGNISLVALYKKKRAYIFMEKKEKLCLTIELEKDFERWGIPTEAHIAYEYSKGGYNEEIDCKEWQMNVSSKTMLPLNRQPDAVIWSIEVTSRNCVPLSEYTMAQYKGENVVYAVNNVFYYDFHPKQLNPKDFDIPPYCSDDVQAEKNMDILAFVQKAFSFSPAMKMSFGRRLQHLK